MDPTSTRTLGRRGPAVSVLGFGGAPIGGFRYTVAETEAVATAEAAHRAGITYFDTSPYYGYGRSEHRVGQALRQVDPDSFVLSTKVGRLLSPLPPGSPAPAGHRTGGLPFAAAYDYSYDGTMRSIEDSYQRLGLSRIDIALIHDVDLFTHGDPKSVERFFSEAMNGAYVALKKLRAAGAIRAIGAGLNETEICTRFQRAGDFDCMMLAGRYTLLNQEALDALLPTCEEKGTSLLIAAPFNSGLLAQGPASGALYNYGEAGPEILQKTRRIEAVCQRHGVALPAAALQFPLGHPCVAAVVPGAISVAEVESNVCHLRTAIPGDMWEELAHEGLIAESAPRPGAPTTD